MWGKRYRSRTLVFSVAGRIFTNGRVPSLAGALQWRARTPRGMVAERAEKPSEDSTAAGFAVAAADRPPWFRDQC